MSQVVTDGEMPSEAWQQSCCRQSDRWASSFRKAGCAFFEIQTVCEGDSIADFIQTMIEKVDCALSVAVQGRSAINDRQELSVLTSETLTLG